MPVFSYGFSCFCTAMLKKWCLIRKTKNCYTDCKFKYETGKSVSSDAGETEIIFRIAARKTFLQHNQCDFAANNRNETVKILVNFT